jgi:hypothetical protein
MEQNTRALLINWAKIKDRIPIKNEDKDPLYIKKLVLLYSGKEALGENTYEEWSKEAETRLASTLNQADPIPLQYKADSVEILAECVSALALAEMSKKDVARTAVEADLNSTCKIAFVAITHVIHSLRLFSAEYLIWVFDGRSENDGSQPYQQLTMCLEVLEELYSPAIKGAFEGDLKPLLNLCEVAFASLFHGACTIAMTASVAQNRSAVKMRHKKSQDTKKYAISLYSEKTWKSKKDAARKIHNEVKAYGETIGWLWNDDFQAHETIYSWILAHTKMNK